MNTRPYSHNSPSEYVVFIQDEARRASNNISERLTGRKPVREQSERASGYIVG